jgi:GTP cyclohydrolase II
MGTKADLHQHHTFHPSDMDVLEAISSMPLRHGHSSSLHSGFDSTPVKRNLDTLHALRRPPIDPIVLAASLSSGPHVTRHHFHHSFGPKVESKQMSRSEREKMRHENQESEKEEQTSRGRAGSYANCDKEQVHDRQKDANGDVEQARKSLIEQAPYPSKQAPRSERLRREKERIAEGALLKTVQKKPDVTVPVKTEKDILKKAPAQGQDLVKVPSNLVNSALQGQEDSSLTSKAPLSLGSLPANLRQSASTELPTTPGLSSIVRPPPVSVRCYARTRIPTPHGEVFCHLYRNNRDNKEHLALIVDTAQNAAGGPWENTVEEAQASTSQSIRSRTLDEVWGPHETEMERIVRGAYVGRLGPNYQVASQPSQSTPPQIASLASPLVRIHSECYTGETIGSQRCDCGEQLDEAIRLIHADSQPAKGVVVYLRQEGRGIGLLDKLMAYNLQDMGHDTVSANILLGHAADARKYDVAAEILRDLGVSNCRLLTNNPEKMEALERERITVTKRVAMIPRVWRHGQSYARKTRKVSTKKRNRNLEASVVSQFDDGGQLANVNDDFGYPDDDEDDDSDASRESYVDHVLRRAGATMLGGSMTRGPELEKYLRTKVERMGHLLDVPTDQQSHSNTHRSPTHHSQDAADSDEGEYDAVDAPLTDEETHMRSSDIRAYVNANQGEEDEAEEEEEDDDEILISH